VADLRVDSLRRRYFKAILEYIDLRNRNRKGIPSATIGGFHNLMVEPGWSRHDVVCPRLSS
jgi:hypothetical protein